MRLRLYGAGPDCYPDQFGNGSDAELVHNAGAVIVYGLRADPEDVGDLFSRLADRKKLKDLQLPRGEASKAGAGECRGVRVPLSGFWRSQLGVQHPFTGRDSLQAVHEKLAGGFLQKIAICPDLKSSISQLPPGMHGENHDPRIGKFGDGFPDEIQAVAVR